MNFFRSRRPALFALAAGLALAMGSLTARAAEHEGAAAESHGEEQPQLLRGPKESAITAITTLIIFGALVAVLGKTAWGPIAKGLQDREDKIRKDIADAEAARQKAETTLKEYETRLAAAEQQVRDMLNKATTQGEQIADNIRNRAQQEAEESRTKALRDIEASRNQAVAEIYDQAAMLATEVAKRVLPRTLSDQDQQALLDRSVEQVRNLRQTAAA